jgi:hypothetical protein
MRPPAVVADDTCRPRVHERIAGVHDDCVLHNLPQPVVNRTAFSSLA